MVAFLSFLFFLSGASALIFQTLWFYLTGIVLGNTVWTVSLVLAAFMSGLSIGSALTFWKGRIISAPVRLYGVLQILIACAGLACVYLFPHLPKLLVPVYRLLLPGTLFLNLFRFLAAFLLLSVPAVCMGVTLPVLVKAVYRRNRNYGGVLGLFYGCNTLGAVAGVLLAEFVLIRLLGVRFTGVVAAGLSLVAAKGAFAVSVRLQEPSLFGPSDAVSLPRIPARTRRLLLAGFLSGALLLALEVIWFRFLTLFFHGLSANFAVMLAMVLLGIASGSLTASWRFFRQHDTHRFVCLLVSLAGVSVCALYAFFHNVLMGPLSSATGVFGVIGAALYLIFPVAFLSGMIFTVLARYAAEDFESKIQATGIFTMMNTFGSMCGALIAGLVLLPHIGMERSFFLICLLYAAVLFLVIRKDDITLSRRALLSHSMAVVLLSSSIILFPFGLMRNLYSKIPLIPFFEEGIKRVAFEEGPNETAQLLRVNLLDEPYYYYLITNNHSMSATTSTARRYMKYFAWFPLTLHPNIEDVLVISYGLGNTASAFTEQESVKHIDVVDVSKEILRLSSFLYRDEREDPLRDARVSVRIEDGRFYLLSTDKKYDVITGEPPPPKNQGVVLLYTEEYFRLMYERLKEGGIVTYWLPVSHLKPSEAKAIVKAFSNVFDDCMLWAALPFDWMLVGTRGLKGPVSDGYFARLWEDERTALKMSGLGFFFPGSFGTLFVADSRRLQEWLRGSFPLTDNYPGRISRDLLDERILDPEYLTLMQGNQAMLNFKKSPVIKDIWPPRMYKQALSGFLVRDFIFEVLGGYEGISMVAKVHRCLSYPLLRNYLLWALESDPDAQAILTEAMNRNRQIRVEEAGFHLAARAVAEGDYLKAEIYYAELMKRYPGYSEDLYGLRMYLLYRGAEEERARLLAGEYIGSSPQGRAFREERTEKLFSWLETIAVGESTAN